MVASMFQAPLKTVCISQAWIHSQGEWEKYYSKHYLVLRLLFWTSEAHRGLLQALGLACFQGWPFGCAQGKAQAAGPCISNGHTQQSPELPSLIPTGEDGYEPRSQDPHGAGAMPLRDLLILGFKCICKSSKTFSPSCFEELGLSQWSSEVMGLGICQNLLESFKNCFCHLHQPS